MADEPLTLPQAAGELGVHYMTAYRYVRTGRLPATRVGGAWEIARSDLDLVRRGVGRSESAGPVPSRRRLESRLVGGDEQGSWNLLEAALASDMTPQDVVLELIAPTMTAIGTRWQRGELSIADEHRASAVATRLIGRLGARFSPRGVKRGSVVLAAPAGELHAMPVAIAANVLRWKGFEVVELGADTPAQAFAETVAREADVVAAGMACTTHGTERAARDAIRTVHRVSPAVPVFLGGAAVTDEEHARKLGADLFTAGRADHLVRVVESVVSQAS